MPRRPRQHVPGGIYHVTLRGNDQQVIFGDEWDFQRFEDLVAEGCERYGTRVHAFCWMTNHIHLAIQVGAPTLGDLMRWMASRYARGFNRRYSRCGHLFERRHWAKLAEDDSYLLALARYIHRNPVDAKIVTKPEGYRWSSYRAYLGEAGVPWLTTSLILSIFGNDESTSRAQFARLVADPKNPGKEWAAEVDTARRLHRLNHPSSVGPGVESCAVTRLNALIDERCQHFGISSDQLTSRSRARRLARARGIIARDAIDNGIATLAEISRRYDRSESVVLRTMNRYGNKAPKLPE